MREEQMLVWGLRCQRCIGSVERSVTALTGVHALLVDAATRRVIVVYEEGRCDRRHIERVIYAEGYDVIPTSEGLGRINIERLADPGDADHSGWGPVTTISW